MFDRRLLAAALLFGPLTPANALQSLDVPPTPTFDDRLPRKEDDQADDEIAFEARGTLKFEKSSLVVCSEGAASGEDLETALVACDDAVAEAPQNGDAYYYRGFVLYLLERFGDAEADFTAAIDFGARKLAESYYQRGACKEAQDRLREASLDFRKAHELKPEWSAARRKVDEYWWAYQ